MRAERAEVLGARAGLPIAADQSAREDSVSGDADAQLATGWEDRVLDPTGDQRVFDLQVADRMDRSGAAECLRADLGQADVADPAFVDAVLERADGVLDRHLRIEPRGAIDVDHLDPQPLKRVGEEVLDRCGTAVESDPTAGMVAQRVELDAKHVIVAGNALERLADQHLVVAHAVKVAGVDERNSCIERGMDRGDALAAIGWAIDP